MSYGIYLKDNDTGRTYFDEPLIFYNTAREGISTSNGYYFNTISFTADKMSLSFDRFANLISSSSASSFSNINFDMNANNFYGVGINVSEPTVVEICEIDGYEIGVANTVFSNDFSENSKILKNYSDPANIYKISSVSPIGLQTSIFSKAINTTYLQPPGFPESYIYVKYDHQNITKYFICIPISSTFTWYELPDEKFYYTSTYYITNNTIGFTGTSLNLSYFNGIIPKINESILINNTTFNDTLSGLYVISKLKDKVYLKPSNLFYNHPGQIFHSKINLDISNSLTHYESYYYVPYSYGLPAEPFSKSLQLRIYSTAVNSASNYIPMMKDSVSESKMILCLHEKDKLTRNSDIFKLGIAVSNWCEDSLLFGVSLNYQIKEGY
jgi:hypothetical protein